jgi:LysM domain
MLKKLLSVVAAAMLALPALAVELKADHPDTYTVKRGDTLWDISAKFLKTPWNWPEIWHANPQVENPHLIYPGDVLSLIYIDGKPYLVSDGGPKIRREAADDAVRAIPLAAIRQFLERPRMLTEEEWKAAPYIVGLEENRLLGMNTNLAYVRQMDAPVGTKFAVARPTVVYRDVPKDYFWQKDDRERRVSAWKNEESKTVGGAFRWLWSDWLYEKNTTVLGYELLEIGSAELVSSGDPATSYVSYVDEEIRRGDILLPVLDKHFDFEYVPHAPKSVPENMRILAFTDAMFYAGTNQVVVLSKGSADGVENGHTFSVYNPGETIRDEIRYGRDGNDVRTVFNPSKAKVTLPEEFAGHVMIFRTFDHISYGLMMDGVKPVRLGDSLRMPIE